MRDTPAIADGSGAMFNQVAPRYDLLNRLMSMGLDHLWRRRLVRALSLQGAANVLDVATGTGDVALAVCRTHKASQVTGLDPSARMLEVAQAKLQARGLQERLQLIEGDAQAMPFADRTFDGACISFGIRNVPNRLLGLQEMVRVCRPKSAVVVLELGEPRDGLLGPLVRFHVHTVVPTLGAWLSGAAEYRYLQRSIAAFPDPPHFTAMMQQAGLVDVTHRRMSFGAVNLYRGVVPES